MKKLLFVILLPVLILAGCTQGPKNIPTPSEPAGSGEPTSSPVILPETPTVTPPVSPDPVPTPEPTSDPTLIPKPRFGFIDAHADTPSKLLDLDPQQRSLYSNPELHIDLLRLSEFGAAVQVFAAWCPGRYIDEVFDYTNLSARAY